MIGFHGSNRNPQNLQGLGDMLRACYEQSGRKVAGITTLDLRLVNELQYVAHWGFRTQKAFFPGGDGDNPPPDAVYGSPRPTARQWIDACVPIWRKNLNPSPSFFIFANEQDPPDIEHASLYDDYSIEAMQYYDETYRAALGGVPLGAYAFSAGCPTEGPTGHDWQVEDMWEALLPSTRYAFNHGHWICLHNHGGPFGTLEASGEYQALRHRRAIAFWRSQGLDLNKCRIDLSETSNSAGGIEPDLTTYINSVRWLLEQLIAERNSAWSGVRFFSLYQFGGAGERLQDAIPALIQLHVEHPLPPIEPTPIEPRRYDRVVHLVPPSVAYGSPQFLQIVDAASLGRQDIEASADSAFSNAPQFRTRRVYVYNESEYGGRDALEAWAQQYYPPLPEIVYLEIV